MNPEAKRMTRTRKVKIGTSSSVKQKMTTKRTSNDAVREARKMKKTIMKVKMAGVRVRKRRDGKYRLRAQASIVHADHHFFVSLF